jgi:hypothetical protein
MMLYTPLIKAWLATTLAAVATASIGQKAPLGTDFQNGSAAATAALVDQIKLSLLRMPCSGGSRQIAAKSPGLAVPLCCAVLSTAACPARDIRHSLLAATCAGAVCSPVYASGLATRKEAWPMYVTTRQGYTRPQKDSCGRMQHDKGTGVKRYRCSTDYPAVL